MAAGPAAAGPSSILRRSSRSDDNGQPARRAGPIRRPAVRRRRAGPSLRTTYNWTGQSLLAGRAGREPLPRASTARGSPWRASANPASQRPLQPRKERSRKQAAASRSAAGSASSGLEMGKSSRKHATASAIARKHATAARSRQRPRRPRDRKGKGHPRSGGAAGQGGL